MDEQMAFISAKEFVDITAPTRKTRSASGDEAHESRTRSPLVRSRGAFDATRRNCERDRKASPDAAGSPSWRGVGGRTVVSVTFITSMTEGVFLTQSSDLLHLPVRKEGFMTSFRTADQLDMTRGDTFTVPPPPS